MEVAQLSHDLEAARFRVEALERDNLMLHEERVRSVDGGSGQRRRLIELEQELARTRAMLATSGETVADATRSAEERRAAADALIAAAAEGSRERVLQLEEEVEELRARVLEAEGRLAAAAEAAAAPPPDLGGASTAEPAPAPDPGLVEGLRAEAEAAEQRAASAENALAAERRTREILDAELIEARRDRRVLRETLEAERRVLAADDSDEKLARLGTEREALLGERDALRIERNSLTLRIPELEADRDRLRLARDAAEASAQDTSRELSLVMGDLITAEAEVARLGAELETAGQARAELERTSAALAAGAEAQRLEHQRLLDEQRRASEALRADQAAKHRTEVERLTDEHLEAVDALEAARAGEAARAAAEIERLSGELQSTREASTHDLERAQALHAAELEAAKAGHAATLEATRTSMTAAHEKTRAMLTEQLEHLRSTLTADLGQARREYATLTAERNRLLGDLDAKQNETEVVRQRLREELDGRAAAEAHLAEVEEELAYVQREVLGGESRRPGLLGRRGVPSRPKRPGGVPPASPPSTAGRTARQPDTSEDIEKAVERRLFGGD